MCLIGIIIWEFGFEFVDIHLHYVYANQLCSWILPLHDRESEEKKDEKQRMKENHDDRPVAK